MDKVEEKKREEKVKKFQDWIYENFREEIKIKLKEETKEYNNNLLEKQLNNYDIHLGEENFIGMMGKKLNEESSKMDSFKEYLEYYISNSNVYEINSEDFSHYIEERKNNDFNIDFNNESIIKKKPKKLEGKDLENYEKFIELFKKDTTFDGFLSKEEYYTYKQLFENFKDNYTNTEEESQLEKLIKKKMIRIIQEYFNIDEYFSMKQLIQKEYNIDANNEKNKEIIKKQLKEMIKNSKGIADL